jgi:hypothetical protein
MESLAKRKRQNGPAMMDGRSLMLKPIGHHSHQLIKYYVIYIIVQLHATIGSAGHKPTTGLKIKVQL